MYPIRDKEMIIELDGLGDHRSLSLTQGPLRAVMIMLLCSLLGDKIQHLIKTKSVISLHSANYNANEYLKEQWTPS